MVLDDGSGMISDSRFAIGDFKFYKSQIAYRPIHTKSPCSAWYQAEVSGSPNGELKETWALLHGDNKMLK